MQKPQTNNNSISDNRSIKTLRDLMTFILDATRVANSLQTELIQIVAILEDSQSHQVTQPLKLSVAGTQTSNGLALSPREAAACAKDYRRTIKYLRGLHSAISDTRALFPERPTRVLYGGCGPLAPLVIPLMAVFSPSDVQFTLLDIHQEAIESV
ncbi:MAG: hypothetical protein AAF614_36450, partial [Chloroflexota bacterium]